MIPFGGSRHRGAFEAAGRFSRVGAEEHGQPCDGAFIIFTFAAYIADPGGEVRNCDQFLAKPGEVGDVPQVHNARAAFTARDMIGV